jgi:hypothetical protein
MAEGEDAGDAGLKTYDVATNGAALRPRMQGLKRPCLHCPNAQ